MGLDYGSDYCVDAGSAQCPCFLAETGGCLSCSLLRGEAFCDCRWTGECIYQRYLLRPLLWAREDRRRVARVSGYEKINERAFLLEIALPQEVAESLKTPGSYLFLRPTALPDDFFAPFSILEVGSEGYVRLAIEILGPKTRLLKYPGREVAVKGPYRNGLMGLRAVKALVGGRALIIAKGI
ncbi:MAG: sulfide/dihydroorotate dehydrogenase-like FAD/NAD-binding protein, partial [Firmicutes bacterium]|nr:sulfide/dihydroorotate dehydrogenase-like FAD/NAD-binding protein [Bacillota bacterium]